MLRTTSEKRNGENPKPSSKSQCTVFTPEYWLEIYDAIRALMRYTIATDLYATQLSESLMYQKIIEHMEEPQRLVSRIFDNTCDKIHYAETCILGGSSTLEEQIRKPYLLSNCETVIAVDGASRLAKNHGIIPDIVVTDLDGSWDTLTHLFKEKTIFVIHAHGDNIAALRLLLPLSPYNRTLLTIQTKPYIGIGKVIGGFTDGDRALVLAIACRAKRIVLLGMNFSEKTGWWSKPWLKNSIMPWREKRKKLAIAKTLMSNVIKYAKECGIEVTGDFLA